MSALNNSASQFGDSIKFDGVFEGGDIGKNVHQILELVSDQERKWIVQIQKNIVTIGNELTRLIDKYKHAHTLDYNFINYENCILMSPEEVREALETEIFQKNGLRKQIWKAFKHYVTSISPSAPADFRKQMEQKVIQEFWLDNLIFEAATPHLKEAWINYSNKAWFESELLKKYPDSALRINLDAKNLGADYLQVIVEILKSSGNAGMQVVSLYLCTRNITLSGDDLASITNAAGKAGIQTLQISSFDYKIETSEQLKEFVHALIHSWIQKIALRESEIAFPSHFDADEVFSWLKNASPQKLKHVYFPHSDLWEKQHAEEIYSFVKNLWLVGVRYLNISWAKLHNALGAQGFAELMRVAGDAGVTWLDICEQLPFTKMSPQDFAQCISQASKHGIRYLRIANITLEWLSPENFLEIARFWPGSSLRSLILDNCLFFTLAPEYVYAFVRACWASKIRQLDISCGAILSDFYDNEMMQLVEIAGYAGIQSLHIGQTGFELRDKWTEAKLRSIAAKYKMHLVL